MFEEIVNDIKEDINEPIEEIVESEPEFETVLGIVTAKKLNVREEPDKDAEIVKVIVKGDEVLIDDTESTDDFYKICTASGVEGFCMKEFIDII